jgi:hypothetical protein
MPVTVKSISLWRKEAENKTGLLAQTLEPLAKAGADLGVVMAYIGFLAPQSSYSLRLAVSRSSFSPLLILAACLCRWATGFSGPPLLSSSASSFNFSSRTCST